MKKLARILLFLFVLFLITPTVVSAIENDGDISVMSNFSEEEKMENDAKLFFLNIENFNCSSYLCTQKSKPVDYLSLFHEEVLLVAFFSPPEV